jgi:hypothetical protein
MAIVYDDVRFQGLVGNDPESSHILSNDLLEEDGAPQIAMAQQPKAKKWIGYPFGEEDSPDTGRDVCKGVPDTANDNILEHGCILCEGRASVMTQDVVLSDELERELDGYIGMSRP